MLEYGRKKIIQASESRWAGKERRGVTEWQVTKRRTVTMEEVFRGKEAPMEIGSGEGDGSACRTGGGGAVDTMPVYRTTLEVSDSADTENPEEEVLETSERIGTGKSSMCGETSAVTTALSDDNSLLSIRDGNVGQHQEAAMESRTTRHDHDTDAKWNSAMM